MLGRNAKVTLEVVSKEASKWAGAVEISLIAACLAPGKLNSIDKTQKQERELTDSIAEMLATHLLVLEKLVGEKCDYI